MKQIKIKERALRTVINQAEDTYDKECCGFLFGEEGDERLITKALPAENLQSDVKSRFSISAEDYMEAEKIAEKEGLVLNGIYHSHPDHAAVPSDHDLRQAVPFFSYIIISVRNGKAEDIRSWQLNEQGKFTEEHLSYTLHFKNNHHHGTINHSHTTKKVHKQSKRSDR